MGHKKVVTFGIVGCGMIAHLHAKSISELPGAMLLGAFSRNRTRTEEFCRNFGIRPYGSFAQLLTDPVLDVVVICTPSGNHAEQTLKALAAGKHVVVEKPMCLSLTDADAIITMSKKTGGMVCVVSQLRFSDGVQAVKRAIERGEMGRLLSASVSMHYFRDPAYYEHGTWHGTLSGDGGGVLMNQGIHSIDILCYLMGKPVSVKGYARTLLREIEVEDTAVAVVDFENQALAVMDATVCARPATPRTLTICGEKGTVTLEEDTIIQWDLPTACSIPAKGSAISTGASDPGAITNENISREYQNVLDHLLEGKELLMNGVQGRIALSVILGIYQSSQTGNVVCL